MAASLSNQLVVAIASRALFDFEEENKVFEQGDDRAYMNLQLERLDIAAKPGVAHSLIKKLLAFNAVEKRVEVVILSRNDPVSGLRVFNSAQASKLVIERGVFTKGREPYKYLKPLRANLFLSANPGDVRAALDAGFAAATVHTGSMRAGGTYPNEVRIAFDGDAVLFSDEAEQVYQKGGLQAFQSHEKRRASKPLPDGPFKPLLAALHALQQARQPHMRIRTALVTARSAPAARMQTMTNSVRNAMLPRNGCVFLAIRWSTWSATLATIRPSSTRWPQQSPRWVASIRVSSMRAWAGRHRASSA